MKAITQRVSSAKVCINNETCASIKKGILAYVCFEKDDNEAVIDKFINKILNYKFFKEDNSIMSASLKELDEDILIISQFTLAAVTNKGNKPSFHKAAPPEKAEEVYEEFVNIFKESASNVKTGKFGEIMNINLINNGPVTFNFRI